jgi:hypothetical protein
MGLIYRRQLVVVVGVAASVASFVLAPAEGLAQSTDDDRLVQATDGTLYLIRDGVRHRVVSTIATDDQLAQIVEGPPLDAVELRSPHVPAAPGNWNTEPIAIDALSLHWEGDSGWETRDGLLTFQQITEGVRLLRLSEGQDGHLAGDFAVEVEIRGAADGLGFGVILTRSPSQSLRVGYASRRVVMGYEDTASSGGFMSSTAFANHAWSLPWVAGADWHTFRLEFRRVNDGAERGDMYQFFVDSQPRSALRFADVPGPGGTQRSTRFGSHSVGLWTDSSPVEVRAVRILAL